MTVSLTTINLKKENIIHYPLMHFQQNVIQFGKYIFYNLTDLKNLLRKKNGTWAEGAGKILPKIHQLTTSNCWKENEKVYSLYNIKKNFVTKKLNHLIKLQSPWLNETTIHLKKGYKIYLQVECHFSYYTTTWEITTIWLA